MVLVTHRHTDGRWELPYYSKKKNNNLLGSSFAFLSMESTGVPVFAVSHYICVSNHMLFVIFSFLNNNIKKN